MLNSGPWSITKTRRQGIPVHENAFTLLEVLLALALFLMVASVLMTVFWNIVLQAGQLQTRAELLYDARQCRQYLISDIHCCEAFTIRDNQGNTADQGSHLYLAYSAETLHYYTYNGKLFRDSTTGTPLPIAENILLVTYTAWNADTFLIHIWAGKGEMQFELETAAGIARYGTETVL